MEISPPPLRTVRNSSLPSQEVQPHLPRIPRSVSQLSNRGLSYLTFNNLQPPTSNPSSTWNFRHHKSHQVASSPEFNLNLTTPPPPHRSRNPRTYQQKCQPPSSAPAPSSPPGAHSAPPAPSAPAVPRTTTPPAAGCSASDRARSTRGKGGRSRSSMGSAAALLLLRLRMLLSLILRKLLFSLLCLVAGALGTREERGRRRTGGTGQRNDGE